MPNATFTTTVSIPPFVAHAVHDVPLGLVANLVCPHITHTPLPELFLPYAALETLVIPAFEVCPVHAIPLVLVETFCIPPLPPLLPTATHKPLPYATPFTLPKAFGLRVFQVFPSVLDAI